MTNYIQTGFFDLSDRYEQLSQCGDPLVKLNEVIDWKVFLPVINRAFEKTRKSAAGRKPYNRLLMFKLLVLQSLYNLSDHQVEFQVRDRLSFMRFLDLKLAEKIPDEKTLWSFREVLVQGKVMEKLFMRFNHYLEKQGFTAKIGSIIDASIVEVPRQRNTREENQQIKAGKQPEEWKDKSICELGQKDLDARWTQKNHKTYYGYKNHINVDAAHKIIRQYAVTSASQADIHSFENLLDARNQGKNVWADSAYRSEAIEEMLQRKGYESRVHYKPKKGGWIGSEEKRQNHRYSKIRARVEHVFGFISNTMKGAYIRTIGVARAAYKIGMGNLTYNLCRYKQCLQAKSA